MVVCFINVFEFYWQIEVCFGEEVGFCFVWLSGFKFQVIVYIVGVIFEDFVGSGVEWQFLDVWIFYLVGEVYQFGVSIFVGGNVLVLFDVVGEDCWYVVQGFYVVDVGWFVLDVGVCWEWWFGLWVGVVVFQRVDQCCFFVVDIVFCFGVYEQFEVKFGVEDVFF